MTNENPVAEVSREERPIVLRVYWLMWHGPKSASPRRIRVGPRASSLFRRALCSRSGKNVTRFRTLSSACKRKRHANSRSWGRQEVTQLRGTRGHDPSNDGSGSERPSCAARRAEAAHGVGEEDGEQIAAREHSVDLQTQNSTSTRGSRVVQRRVRRVRREVMVEGAAGRHGEDQAADKYQSGWELNQTGPQGTPSPSVEVGTNLRDPTRRIG